MRFEEALALAADLPRLHTLALDWRAGAVVIASSTLLGLAIDDVRDVLEEDPAALTALADRLAGLLLEQA